MFKVNCEWDIGLENTVFATKELAKRDAAQALKDSDTEGDIDDLIDEGLVSFAPVDVVTE